ncbi:6-hydroxymethylpterin diphosphokinase MptE-like protein [Cohnella suwonensis]|uniref:6-hydroxymethylpterin diphosphokinase MptE-like protein n=1 Tax=Cohnella suwonensis TaxID=696072 RepID=A0ABW0LUZ6_9BACL
MGNTNFEIKPVLEEIKAFLPNLIQACETVANMFYESVQESAWDKFGELLQGMDDLFKTANAISREIEHSPDYASLIPVLGSFTAQLSERFEPLNRSMDEEEFVHAADSIKFELAPLFEGLAISLGEGMLVAERRFAANLTFLKQRFRKAFDVIQHLKPEQSRYQICRARNGLSNLFMFTKDGKERYFYSTYDPEHEAERWVETIAESVNGKANVIVYGFSFGYHLSQLAKRYPEKQYVIFEPDEQMLLAAMRVIDLQQLFSQIKIKDFVVGRDKVLRESSFFEFFRLAKGDPALLSVPMYDKLNLQQKLEFCEDAKVAIQTYEASVHTYHLYGMQWLKNRLYNMAVNITTPSLAGLKEKLVGIPAVIVGAGPSLKEDIEHLRQLKDHALIIAAGSSIQSLRHFGIEPHLIVSMDGGDINYEVFRNTDTANIPLLYVPQIEYRILEEKEELFHAFFNNDLTTRYLAGWTNEDPVFNVTHSVTGTAVQAAIYMGCREVVLAGQDLSYPVEQVYAPGAKHVYYNYSKDVLEKAGLQVENVRGGMNRTTEAMYITLRDMEDLLALHPTVHFINTTSMGAKIKNTEWQPMKNVLERLRTVSIPSDFMLNAIKGERPFYDELRMKQMTGRLVSLTEQLAQLENQLKQIDRKLEGLEELSRTKPKKCMDTMVDIEEIWGKIVNGIPFMILLTTAMMNEIRLLDRELPELAEEKNVIKKVKLFYEVLSPFVRKTQMCLPELNELVGEANRKLKLRSANRTTEVPTHV